MSPPLLLVIPAEVHPSDHSFLEEVHTRDASALRRTFLMRSEHTAGSSHTRWNQALVRSFPARSGWAPLRWFSTYFFDLRYVTEFLAAIRHEHPDAIYVRDLTFPLFLALILRPWAKWRVLYQRSFPHEMRWFDPERIEGYRLPSVYVLARRIEGPLLRALLRRADAVLPISSLMAAEMVHEGTCSADRLFPFGMGVTRDVIERAHAPHRRPGDPLRMVYVGTLALRRRMERLIEAVSLARERHGIDVRLTLIGGTPPEIELLSQTVDALQLTSCVELVGRVRRQEIYARMAQYDAGAIYIGRDPRFRVASTTKLLECLALGLPCVATDAVQMHGALAQEGRALVVTGDSPEDYARGIVELDQRWEELGAAAYEQRDDFYRRYAYESARSRMDALVIALISGSPLTSDEPA